MYSVKWKDAEDEDAANVIVSVLLLTVSQGELSPRPNCLSREGSGGVDNWEVSRDWRFHQQEGLQLSEAVTKEGAVTKRSQRIQEGKNNKNTLGQFKAISRSCMEMLCPSQFCFGKIQCGQSPPGEPNYAWHILAHSLPAQKAPHPSTFSSMWKKLYIQNCT